MLGCARRCLGCVSRVDPTQHFHPLLDSSVLRILCFCPHLCLALALSLLFLSDSAGVGPDHFFPGSDLSLSCASLVPLDPLAGPAERAPQDLASRGHPSRNCYEDPWCHPRKGWQVRPQARVVRVGRADLFPAQTQELWSHLCPPGSWNPQGVTDFLESHVFTDLSMAVYKLGCLCILGIWGSRAVLGFLPVLEFL